MDDTTTQTTNTPPTENKHRLPAWQPIVITLVLGLIITASTFWILKGGAGVNDPFTPEIRKAVSLPIYYPAQLPDGYAIEPTSIALPEKKAVTFKVINNHAQKFFVSETDATEKDSGLKNLAGNLTNVRHFSTPHGQATSGTTNNGQTNMVSIIIDNKTWVILNSGKSVPISALESTVNHLTLSK